MGDKKEKMEKRKWELATHGRADAGHYRRAIQLTEILVTEFLPAKVAGQ
jgi:hypothetical protein